MAGTPPFWSAILTESLRGELQGTGLVQLKVFLTYTAGVAPRAAQVLRNIFVEVKEDERG